MACRVWILVAVAMTVCLGHPGAVRAQLTAEEYKVFQKLLAEPDGKAATAKRLAMIAEGLERWGDPKRRPSSTYGINLKQACIPAEDGVPFLLAWSGHPADMTRRTAIGMLADYEAEARPAVPKLRQHMDDPVPRVREDAMHTLSKIDSGNRDIAAAIVERLGAPASDDSQNRAVMGALIRMAPVVPKSALPTIIKFREHRWTDVCLDAYELAGKVLNLERPSLDKLKAMEFIDWQGSPDQGYAILAAIREAGPQAEPAMPLLVELLSTNPPVYLQCAVLETLAKVKTGHPRIISALLDGMVHNDPVLRNSAIVALRQVDLKAPPSVRAMAKGLRHADPKVRYYAAVNLRSWDQLGKLTRAGLAEMLPPLLENLREVNADVSPGLLEVYVQLLRHFGPDAAPVAEPLLKIYTSEAYFKNQTPADAARRRGWILATLGNVGVPASARSLVLEALKSDPVSELDSGFLFTAAARAIGTFGPEAREAVPLLLPLLQADPQSNLVFDITWSAKSYTTPRVEAMRALARIGPDAKEALPLLKDLAARKPGPAGSIDAIVPQEARRAIEAIEGKGGPAPGKQK